MKKNIIKISALFILAISVISCSNITKLETVVLEKKSYLTLSIGKEGNSRTIMPEVSVTNLSDFVLTGVKTEEGSTETPESQSLGSWDTLAQLQSAIVPVSPGQWTFTLTAMSNGTTLKGTLEKTIVAGNNSLSFELKIINLGNGNGEFSVILSYADAENASLVSYATATIETPNLRAVTGFVSKTLTPQNGIVTYSEQNVPAGAYWIIISLYTEADVEIAYYREIVQISTNCLSHVEPSIDNLDKLYNITYHLNNGVLPQGTTLQTTVTGKSEIDLPSLTRDYYTFGGWYTDQSFTSRSKIERINRTQDNMHIYAKFTPVSYAITYNLNGGTNPANTISEYTVEDNVTLPEPQYQNYNFMGWYLNSTFSGEAVEDWTAGSRHGVINLYAKWE